MTVNETFFYHLGTRVVVIFEVRNFLVPNSGFVRFREKTHWVKLFTNRFIFTRCSMTLKFHEMSYNDAKRSIYVFACDFRLDEDRDMG